MPSLPLQKELSVTLFSWAICPGWAQNLFFLLLVTLGFDIRHSLPAIQNLFHTIGSYSLSRKPRHFQGVNMLV
jgi:hypothetical protein